MKKKQGRIYSTTLRMTFSERQFIRAALQRVNAGSAQMTSGRTLDLLLYMSASLMGESLDQWQARWRSKP